MLYQYVSSTFYYTIYANIQEFLQVHVPVFIVINMEKIDFFYQVN